MMKKEQNPANRHNISVLFVDDNDSIRLLYQRILEKHVNNFYVARNGKHGLELYKEHRPDIVITDINMPVMDGLEMVREIKVVDPNAKIIVMSAYNVKDNFIKSINLGVDGYLMKPVEAKKLLSLIDEFAGITMMRMELEQKERKRKEAEEFLRKSLVDKEVLLREVHHRVKNNMQIISSILRMQSRNIEDPKLQEVLQESQNRIHSMALIHENLYSNESLAEIKFLNYVKSLSGNIARTYQNQQIHVLLNYDIDDAYLPIDIAIPCGLIINELISNSFKYAFKNMNRGEINIKYKEKNDGFSDLEVSDNGVGISNKIIITETKSLGMKIIQNLAKQIDSELKTNFTNGTKFTLTFKTPV